MAEDIKKRQEDVNRQIDDAYNRLDDLKNCDDGIAEELERLKGQRQQFILLSEVNDRLEKLDKLGSNDLFWGDDYDPENVKQHNRRIHKLVADFDSRYTELQEKQQ